MECNITYQYHYYIEWTVCHVLISLKQVPCQEVWVCPFRNIRLSVLFRHVLSSRPLGSFFSCHMHSQCVAMGAASYVKLSRAFTTSKCNFRQRTKGFNGTHSVKPSQFSRLFVLSNLFHQIEMTLPCAGPLAPSTVVPMQNRRSASAGSSLSWRAGNDWTNSTTTNPSRTEAITGGFCLFYLVLRFLPLHPFHTLFSLLSDISEK